MRKIGAAPTRRSLKIFRFLHDILLYSSRCSYLPTSLFRKTKQQRRIMYYYEPLKPQKSERGHKQMKQSLKNNLFNYATSELSQDAFICNAKMNGQQSCSKWMQQFFRRQHNERGDWSTVTSCQGRQCPLITPLLICVDIPWLFLSSIGAFRFSGQDALLVLGGVFLFSVEKRVFNALSGRTIDSLR